jgi:hypothetical protein
MYEPDDDKKVEPVNMAVKDMPKATVFQVRYRVSGLTDLTLVRRRIPSRETQEDRHWFRCTQRMGVERSIG